MDLSDLLGRPARWASVLRWSTLAGLELGVIGPFGSYKANFFTRVVYWTLLFGVGGLTLWPSVVGAMVLGPRKGLPPLFSGTAAVLVACVPLAAVSAAGCYLFWPVHASGIGPLEWYGLTTVVVLPGVAGLLWLELARSDVLPGGLRPTPVTAPGVARDEQVPTRAPATSPLPDHLLAAAHCLQMEDHHVRIHLRGRSVLHHAGMGRVVDAVDGRDGLQVHRSWWVAREAVRGWWRDGRSVTLILADGLRVPVARHRVATLRAHGWLDPACEVTTTA